MFMVGRSRIRGAGAGRCRVVADARLAAVVCAASGDARKLASLFDAARHHALRVETAQQALCDASTAICEAYDWTAIAKEKFVLDCAIECGTYIPRVTS